MTYTPTPDEASEALHAAIERVAEVTVGDTFSVADIEELRDTLRGAARTITFLQALTTELRGQLANSVAAHDRVVAERDALRIELEDETRRLQRELTRVMGERDRAEAERSALPEHLRLGVGGADPPRAAKTQEELDAAMALVKAMGKRIGVAIYDGDTFVRFATQEEDDAFVVVYQTGIAAGKLQRDVAFSRGMEEMREGVVGVLRDTAAHDSDDPKLAAVVSGLADIVRDLDLSKHPLPPR